MNLPTEIFGAVMVVHTPEEIGDQAEMLQRFLTTLERDRVVLDMDGTETIDSRGLAALLDAQDTLRLAGGDLKVCTGNAVNRKILEITRLEQHIEVYEDLIEAVKSFA